jgi:hypothetical protein
MADLLVDLDALDGLHRQLSKVKSVFDQASCTSQHLGDSVGDDDLRNKVREFESTWDDRRHKISESMGVVANAVNTIAMTFREIDAKLGAALDPTGHTT